MTTIKLTDEEWDKVREFLRNEPKAYVGSDENECRRFVEGVVWISRSGACCRLNMETGIVFTNASPAGVTRACGSVCWPTLPMIPTWKMAWWTAPSCAHMPVLPEPQKNGGQAEQALGRSRGGFSTKIHVTVDGLGNPLRLHLTAGQRHDIIPAHDLILDLNFD